MPWEACRLLAALPEDEIRATESASAGPQKEGRLLLLPLEASAAIFRARTTAEVKAAEGPLENC
jgi:hypothetical protein